ncbi:hypothetical protein L226DRAFT_375078 [Lentinus tigrinus ALCF2SS1-7]|uniref:F-box domain-containing protein n=1 Tax=Lentinus tigrinus ALCF2SS1-6 TaxID=1328759 RepID=A0A5C2SM01_9APHY|nr:hypothetical protein L227DRAFT_320648 [Lentinus tigrinus ALCF2SS1-6]RPD76386.1 hypothetical protein L226DRAFT_375078 [Lentinus tigrinus ALCF2SS1-7]
MEGNINSVNPGASVPHEPSPTIYGDCTTQRTMAAHQAGPFPLDIWNLVYDLLHEHSDILSLMHTCGVLYGLGVRALIRLPVRFDYVSDLRSFCDFVLADLAKRPGLIRLLEICISLPRLDDGDQGGPEEEEEEEEGEEEELLRVFPDLALVLCGASKLEHLRIGFAEELLHRADISANRGICPPHLRLTTVLSSLHSVAILELASYGPRTASLLQSMTSPLRGVEIKLYDTRRHASPDFYPDFPRALDRYKNTLTSISVCDVQLGHPLAPPNANATRFPLVQQLRLMHVMWPSLAVLIHAFPNLKFLDITSPISIPIPGGQPNTAVSAVRESNRRVPAAVSWPSLQSLAGDLEALFVLGVTGRRRLVEIGNFDVHEGFVRMFNAVLLDMLPTHLILHVGYGARSALMQGRRTDLITLLQHVPAPLEITYLQLNVCRHVLLRVIGMSWQEEINLGLVQEALLPFRRLRHVLLYVSRSEDPTKFESEPMVKSSQLGRGLFHQGRSVAGGAHTHQHNGHGTIGRSRGHL